MSLSLASVARFGALVWILSEVVELATAGFSPISLVLSALAFCALAAGVWALVGDQPRTRSWTAVTGLASLGFAGMAAVSLTMLGGAAGHDDGPLFIGAITTFSLGMLGMGGLSVGTGRHPRAVGIGFVLASLFALGTNAAEAGALANLGNIALSVALLGLAWPPAAEPTAQPTPAAG